jgi:hypothetical protein
VGMAWRPGQGGERPAAAPARDRRPRLGDGRYRADGGAGKLAAADRDLLDISHFYPLHDGTIGDAENSRIPVRFDEGVRDGNAYVGTIREARGYRQPPFLEDYLGYDVVDRDHTHFMLSPAATRVGMRIWPAGRHGDPNVERGYVIIHTHTPIDRTNHVWRLIINMPAGQTCKIRPDPVGSRALYGNLPRGNRRGPLGGAFEAGQDFSRAAQCSVRAEEYFDVAVVGIGEHLLLLFERERVPHGAAAE